MRAFMLCLLFYLLPFAIAGKQFRLGRSKGGNLGAPGNYGSENLPPAQWFKQKLDHFSPSNLKTWKQRYFVNDSFYDFKNPGPVFLMIGGEGPVNPTWMVEGAWIEYAKKFRALCISLEHRYYGESHPTEDLSTKNLQYLSSYQALADLANFIKAMNEKHRFNKDVKWVAFGGSYAGSLAAWLRLKYPHLIHSAISSSGPILAKVNFMEYFQVVVNALREKTGSDDCVTALKQAHEQIVMMMKIHPEEIEKEFRVCKDFGNITQNDLKIFYNSIANDFADLVQYNEDNRVGANKNYRNITINSVCDMLTEPSSSPAYKKLAAFNSLMLDESDEPCLDYIYENTINELRNTSWGSDEYRQWMYQTCTEFGFYQTSSSEVEVFGDLVSLSLFIQQCQDVFGKKFDENFINAAVEWTNDLYGGFDISVSRVVFVHGSIDPWHALGIIKTEDNNAPSIYIQGTSHCANMYPPSEDDASDLMEARVEIEQYLITWVGLP